MYQNVRPTAESDNNDFKEYPQDLANHFNKHGGEKKLFAELAIQQYLNNLKVPMLIHKIEEASDSLDTTLAELIRSVTNTTGHGVDSLPEAIKIIKERRFRAVTQIKKLSWQKLEMLEPKLTLVEESKITGVSIDDLMEIKGIEKPLPPPKEEDKEEVLAVEKD